MSEKKVLFVSDCITENNGKGVVGSSNLKSISRTYGKQSVDICLISHYTESGKNQADHLVNNHFLITQNDTKSYILKESFFLRHFRSTKRVEREYEKIIARQRYDVIFFDDSYFGNLVRLTKRKSDAVTIVFFHNCRRQLALNWLYNSPIKFLPFYFSTLRQERLSSRFADKLAVLNKKDSRLIEYNYKRSINAILPVAVDDPINGVKNVRTINKKLTVGFLGANYHPNVKGISWFIKNVLPLLDEPISLMVAGRGMESFVDVFQALNKSDSVVNTIGFIEDLNGWYSSIDIIVSPIFEGGGMKVKVAEALSHGKYILVSPESYHGYTFDSHAGLICSDKADFAKGINSIRKRGIIDEEAIYRQFKEAHSIDAAQVKFKRLIG